MARSRNSNREDVWSASGRSEWVILMFCEGESYCFLINQVGFSCTSTVNPISECSFELGVPFCALSGSLSLLNSSHLFCPRLFASYPLPYARVGICLEASPSFGLADCLQISAKQNKEATPVRRRLVRNATATDQSSYFRRQCCGTPSTPSPPCSLTESRGSTIATEASSRLSSLCSLQKS